MSDARADRRADPSTNQHPRNPSVKAWSISLAVLSLVAAGALAGPHLVSTPTGPAAAAPPPSVAASMPVQRDVNTRLQFVGQFSALNMVLTIATGAGAEMRQSLGTAVFFGMLGVTIFGLLFTPTFYVLVSTLGSRRKL